MTRLCICSSSSIAAAMADSPRSTSSSSTKKTKDASFSASSDTSPRVTPKRKRRPAPGIEIKDDNDADDEPIFVLDQQPPTPSASCIREARTALRSSSHPLPPPQSQSQSLLPALDPSKPFFGIEWDCMTTSRRRVVYDIVNHRQVDGKQQFLVRWDGCRADEDTWEPAENLLPHCASLIDGYMNLHGPVAFHRYWTIVLNDVPGSDLVIGDMLRSGFERIITRVVRYAWVRTRGGYADQPVIEISVELSKSMPKCVFQVELFFTTFTSALPTRHHGVPMTERLYKEFFTRQPFVMFNAAGGTQHKGTAHRVVVKNGSLVDVDPPAATAAAAAAASSSSAAAAAAAKK